MKTAVTEFQLRHDMIPMRKFNEVGLLPEFPFFLFLLWELPSMIMMSLHKLWCAVTGRSLQESFGGV